MAATKISIVIVRHEFLYDRYSDPDPLWTRIHFSKCGSTITERCSEDPDPLFPNVDPSIRIQVKMRWIRNADINTTGLGVMMIGDQLNDQILSQNLSQPACMLSCVKSEFITYKQSSRQLL